MLLFRNSNVPKAVDALAVWVLILSAFVIGALRKWLTDAGWIPHHELTRFLSVLFVAGVLWLFVKIGSRSRWTNSPKVASIAGNSFWVIWWLLITAGAIWAVAREFSRE